MLAAGQSWYPQEFIRNTQHANISTPGATCLCPRLSCVGWGWTKDRVRPGPFQNNTSLECHRQHASPVLPSWIIKHHQEAWSGKEWVCRFGVRMAQIGSTYPPRKRLQYRLQGALPPGTSLERHLLFQGSLHGKSLDAYAGAGQLRIRQDFAHHPELFRLKETQASALPTYTRRQPDIADKADCWPLSCKDHHEPRNKTVEILQFDRTSPVRRHKHRHLEQP